VEKLQDIVFLTNNPNAFITLIMHVSGVCKIYPLYDYIDPLVIFSLIAVLSSDRVVAVLSSSSRESRVRGTTTACTTIGQWLFLSIPKVVL
jgi:hypothetical protein